MVPLQGTDALAAVRLVERGVRLVGAYEVFRRFHDCAVERDDGVGDTHIALATASARGLGNLAELAVESHTHEFPFIPLCFQHFHKISCHNLYLLLKLGFRLVYIYLSKIAV